MLVLRSCLYGRTVKRTLQVCSRRLASHRPNVIDELSARGLLHATTTSSLADVTSKKRTVYLGLDPTADSLHIGNLLALITLLHFHIRGHQTIALIGGVTGMIGDPSGRSSERNLLAEDDLARNVQGITKQVHRFLERGALYAAKRIPFPIDNENQPKVLNNNDWLGKVTLLEFLRTVGKQARVNQMIAKESVKTRLESESGISFTEFSYQLLQAYDFYVLHRDYGCSIQIGGSDQWGNITAGTNLIRHLTASERGIAASEMGITPSEIVMAPSEMEIVPMEIAASEMGSAAETAPPYGMTYGLTIPLLTTSSGEKFGKSLGNAIWLKEKKTSLFDFYQFFVRVEDADVERYLRMLTLLSDEEIAELMTWHKGDPGLRIAQKKLADEVIEIVHGEEGLRRARIMTRVLYSTNIDELDPEDVISAFHGHPRLVIKPPREVLGQYLTKLTSVYKMLPSIKAGQRVINAGGMYINNVRVTWTSKRLEHKDLINGKLAIIRAGKKEHLLIAVRPELDADAQRAEAERLNTMD